MGRSSRIWPRSPLQFCILLRPSPTATRTCARVHTHTPQHTRLPVHPLYPLATPIRTVTLLVSSVLTKSENLTKVH